jgi:hypothetical protein
MEGAMEADPERFSADGYTFLRARRADSETTEELATGTGIELDAESCQWTVKVPGAGTGTPVVSKSRGALHFMRSVTDEMRRASRRAKVRPVPKPVSKKPPVAATMQVPCPACQGAGQYDCLLCDDTGIVTRRQAEAWERGHED